MAREEGKPVGRVRDDDLLDEGERRLDQDEDALRFARPEPDLERAAQQALLGQECVLAVEDALERPMLVHAFGLTDAHGRMIPFGQLRVVEAAGVVEAHPVETHASISSVGSG